LWKSLAEILGWPDLEKDERFATNKDRLAHREELVPMLADRFRKKSSKEWLAKLAAADIPAGPILSPEAALDDRHLLTRGMIVELQHPAIGWYRTLGNPMHFSATPVSYRRPAPMLGEHNAEILTEIGYGKREIARLRKAAVV
jgi:crotonobetainyl-CoA:carnitine CoA-transferase CaiB-like acyl-CoA transferase